MTETSSQTFDGRLDALPQAERFLLQSMRAWACCCRGRRLPAEPVSRAFAALGIPDGAKAIDAAMTRLVLDTRRPLTVLCPPQGDVTADEARLLAAAAAAQEHDRARAGSLLAALLPAASAAAVVASLTQLGLHLAAAGMPLRDGSTAGPGPRPTLH